MHQNLAVISGIIKYVVKAKKLTALVPKINFQVNRVLAAAKRDSS